MTTSNPKIPGLSCSYRNLPKRFYTEASSSDFPEPSLLLFHENLAEELGLLESLNALTKDEKAKLFSGGIFPEGASPIAQAYSGHQFGYLNILGDGRAMLIGECQAPSGRLFDIQLKGSGRTPYSRGGDGKATLAPMLREYLISEAVHALGIPSTRSLAVVTTGEEIFRNEYLPGAVLTRIAASHLRVGTFEFAAMGSREDIRRLADYAIERHDPDLASQGPEKYLLFLRRVIERQAKLIAKWQLIGFIHGVMNTDNMTISGETIDYGPCAFMDSYEPSTVFSSIDSFGRYRYENQPAIGQWNLARFAETLIPLLDEEPQKALAAATAEVNAFKETFQTALQEGFSKKIGFYRTDPVSETLIRDLLALMQEQKADYTNTFIRLTKELCKEEDHPPEGTEPLFSQESFRQWKKRWREALFRQDENRDQAAALMQSVNPFVIPRNFRVEEVLEKALEGDLHPFTELLDVLRRPYACDPNLRKYQELPKVSMKNYRTYCGT